LDEVLEAAIVVSVNADNHGQVLEFLGDVHEDALDEVGLGTVLDMQV
jgi:hypothetical protein